VHHPTEPYIQSKEPYLIAQQHLDRAAKSKELHFTQLILYSYPIHTPHYIPSKKSTTFHQIKLYLIAQQHFDRAAGSERFSRFVGILKL